MIERINEALDQLLASLDSYADEVEEALKLYKRPFKQYDMDIDIEHGFNQWLIHDYVTKGGHKFASKVLNDKASIHAIETSVYSVFHVLKEKVGYVFKDVFTGVDYVIETDQLFEANDLICIRLYPVGEKNYIVDNALYYEKAFEPTIRRSVMNKYNEFCSTNEPIAIEAFIKSHSQLIYHLNNIVHFYENELEEESDLSVFVAEYAVKDKEALLDQLLDTEHFQIIESYEDEMILVLLDDQVQIGEVVVTPNKMEIEANTQTTLEFAKDIVKRSAGDKAVFVKEAELSIDDLLQ